ncbi:MAG: addiction module protein [bacterium]
MLSIKESAKKIIDDLPDDVTYDELIQELLFKRMIERGLRDSQENRVISDEELRKEIEKEWAMEAEKRLQAYKEGKLDTISFEDM